MAELERILYKSDRVNYKRNFLAALSASLFLMILIFTFFPEVNGERKNIYVYREEYFVPILPPVIQLKAGDFAREKKPPVPVIPVASLEEDIVLEDVSLDDNSFSESKGNVPTIPGNKGRGEQNEGKYFTAPRQVFEVFPEKGEENIKGKISLSLKIGKDGKVKEHKIILNNTGCGSCEKKVIDAAYKSRWEPLRGVNAPDFVWIEKSYVFN